jgi:hypothetical protein
MMNHEPLFSSMRNGATGLLAAFGRRYQDSPGASASEILAKLAASSSDFGDASALRGLAKQTEHKPYVLETFVYVLRRKGVWPGDPKVALRCYSEILDTILESAPRYGVPWELTAEAVDRERPVLIG